MTKILAFSGSSRKGSFNQNLVTIAAEAAQRAGLEVKLINLGDFPLPIFSEDTEAEGTPAAAKELKQLFMEAEGFLISTPEYNSTLTPLFKNALDWVSRPVEGEEMLAPFADKPAAILSASPSGYGGARAIAQLRTFLTNIKIKVVEQEFSLASAGDAFDETGKLKDATAYAQIEAVTAALAKAFD